MRQLHALTRASGQYLVCAAGTAGGNSGAEAARTPEPSNQLVRHFRGDVDALRKHCMGLCLAALPVGWIKGGGETAVPAEAGMASKTL